MRGILFLIISASVLVIIFIIFVFFIVFGGRTGTQGPSNVSPTTVPKGFIPKGSKEDLGVGLISPEERYLKELSVISSITLEFDKPLDPETFEYEISPNIDLTISLDGPSKILEIKPTDIWKPNTEYVLTIKRALGYDKTSILKKSYFVKFKAVVGEDDLDSPAERTAP